eukprot:TRINITY_DN2989_c0_g1_i1.p1 TRINITY_DN2989_c0_g1~~TRINITY_DN2989_c0_g1_i1.p1  ORF type:complete len:95 (+),score=0.87 TRINITY_DN2989_c0_g1_i1:142-426(+)
MKVSVLKNPNRVRKAVITLTDTAARRLSELISAKSPTPMGIRLGVRTRGCNGLSYTMDYAQNRDPKDEIVTDKGVTVLIEPKALMSIIGTEWTG